MAALGGGPLGVRLTFAMTFCRGSPGRADRASTCVDRSGCLSLSRRHSAGRPSGQLLLGNKRLGFLFVRSEGCPGLALSASLYMRQRPIRGRVQVPWGLPCQSNLLHPHPLIDTLLLNLMLPPFCREHSHLLQTPHLPQPSCYKQWIMIKIL